MKCTGGWSGSSATVSIGSGGLSSRVGPRPVSRPALLGWRCQRRDPSGGAFGDVALDCGHAIELLEPDAVGQRVDKAGDVRFRRFGQAVRGRAVTQRLGERSRQRHQLDAEPGVYVLDLVAEEPRQTLGIAHGLRRADPNGLDPVVDAVTQKLQLARAEGLRDSSNAHRSQTSCLTYRAIVSAAPIGSAKLRFTGSARHADRRDRLDDPAERLIETTADFGPEPQRQRRARLRLEFSDAVEPHAPQPGRDVGSQA